MIMGYIKNSSIIEIGNVVKTTKEHSSVLVKFTKGSIVKIVDIDHVRGYTIEDENGNRVSEIGWTI
jgi:sorbitol-specific phosphotransferase system component IIA